MADISATYVSGTQLNIGVFGATNTPGTWVSGTFLSGTATEINTIYPRSYNVVAAFIGSPQLNIGVFGPTATPGIWASGSFLDGRAYDLGPILPLTSINDTSSSANYWLS